MCLANLKKKIFSLRPALSIVSADIHSYIGLDPDIVRKTHFAPDRIYSQDNTHILN